MQHAIGRATAHRIAWRQTGTSNHAALRHFYGSRNIIAIVRRYLAHDPDAAMHLLWSRVKVVVLMTLFERDRGAKLRAAARGVFAGLRGEYGPAPASVTDSAR